MELAGRGQMSFQRIRLADKQAMHSRRVRSPVGRMVSSGAIQ